MMQKEIITRIVRHLGPQLAHEVIENNINQLLQQIDISHAPRVIGFCGAAGAGKDTASFILGLLGYQKLAFADALKIEVYDSIMNPTKEYRDRVVNELDIVLNHFPSLDVANSDFEKIEIINRRKVVLRRLLQWHGTEYRRKQDDQYWINKVKEKISSGRWVISDVRFQNEIQMIRSEHGQVWLIDGRDDGYTPSHASETDWKNTTFDQVFNNNGDLSILQNALYRHFFNRDTKAV